MKKLLTSTAVAAFALMSASGAFAAGTHGLVTGNGGYGDAGPDVPFWGANGYNGDGSASMPDDSTLATPEVTRSFTITGTVAADCSYFTNGSDSQTIDIGAIGVRNGDDESVGTLYNQIDTINIDNQSTGAGCNTDNTVSVTKNEDGLTNPSASGYDTNEFTNHIPYSVTVGIQNAVAAGDVGPGEYMAFVVGTGDSEGSSTFGAWRSLINAHVTIPAQSLGLIAGTYSDTMTVTLAAGVGGDE